MFSLCTLSLEGGRGELDTRALNNEQTMTSRRPQSQGDREKMRAETPGFHMNTAALWTQVRNEGFLAKSDPRFLFQFHNILLQCRCVCHLSLAGVSQGRWVLGQIFFSNVYGKESLCSGMPSVKMVFLWRSSARQFTNHFYPWGNSDKLIWITDKTKTLITNHECPMESHDATCNSRRYHFNWYIPECWNPWEEKL